MSSVITLYLTPAYILSMCKDLYLRTVSLQFMYMVLRSSCQHSLHSPNVCDIEHIVASELKDPI